MTDAVEDETFDPIAIIRVLNRNEVPFVVIGGIAAGVQGAIWATLDLDICHGRERADYQRLAAALTELEARPEAVAAGVEVKLDAAALRHGDWWSLRTKHGKLDCLGEPAPGVDFVFLAPRAIRFEGEESYLVASFEDLIRMKREAGRPKDIAHIELLRAAEEELANRASEMDEAQ
jgi:hypothetical protein